MNHIMDQIIRMMPEFKIEPRTIDLHAKLQEDCEWFNAREGGLHLKDGYQCDLCKNKGVIFVVRESEIVVRDCKCVKVRDILRRAKRSGLGNSLMEFKFTNFDDTEDWQKAIKQGAMEFCQDDEATMFYIGGQSGAGKTHLCTAIVAHYIKQGKDCRYLMWRDDVVRLKQVVNEPEYQNLIGQYKQADVLYIDDLFKTMSGESPSKADVNIAFELINHRILDTSKVTIISSEFTIQEALSFDEATIGRVYQAAGKYKYNISRSREKNYRLRA